MFNQLKIWKRQGKQYITDVTTTDVPGVFRGRPEILGEPKDDAALRGLCPTGAIGFSPLSIDMGKCMFCGECAFAAPDLIRFSKNYKMGSNDRQKLIINSSVRPEDDLINPDAIRAEIRRLFGRSLKLRQVSAGGDGSSELELNATGNVNFDIGRFGIDFVASPRHADGIVLTGPISRNMAGPFKLAYEAVAAPRLLILAGTDAISGGLLADSQDVDRSVLDGLHVDLYVPGNPPHPLTFVNAVLGLLGRKNR
ncbi:MAG: NADH:ubiquinone oxidoreductase [Bacteroidales bacterium]|nr:NADH:ubiquinone oxidoreductase [Bacteroidales bacterium]